MPCPVALTTVPDIRPCPDRGTKYGELIASHEWDDGDGSTTPRATVIQQQVTVRWDAEPTLEFQIHIEYSNQLSPFASYAKRVRRVPGSMQYEPAHNRSRNACISGWASIRSSSGSLFKKQTGNPAACGGKGRDMVKTNRRR
ncbi:hypothetical protein [Halalkaliarchaeum sp. AArc-CO]|uniref:hypothetical protein n=1 Tax=Halalkaliarchaeum sp. AArc-CO TaxID=2866381 RepID=UPI00217E6296|nr:hypothetical protein [Halalkaliarchaeum sp. AArc-CO]